MQSTWLHSLCHDATAIEMQQSKIQCYSHHTPIQLLAQPIITDTTTCNVWVLDDFQKTAF